ncbi:MAG: tRNA (cytidine(34)-2'-O)-methyltransferase [Burkholderiales bacterium]|nr:tRNA (cytidine(34)-2'-O)-methyltransferase [Burkholderiales bacterium]
MFDVVLFQPEIPPNTGNAIRLCANTGCRLHLIEPLGFDLSDRQLKRAGLDYHALTVLTVHASLDACVARLGEARRWLAFSAHASTDAFGVRYGSDDVLLFGPESRGLPDAVLGRVPPEQHLRLPMRAGNRGLNLSNSVAVVVYEAWRQHGFAGAAP